jgi:hypothetical protein
MKLQELSAPKPAKQIAKVFESYFGNNIKFDRLTTGQTRAMLTKVRGILGEARKSSARHTSEQNPQYLQLVMMEQALVTRLSEDLPVPPGQQAQQTDPAQAVAKVKDPKLAAALKKSAAGQTLNPDEQKMVAGAALMKAESRLRNAYRMLKESEVQQAQVVLAAQDLVDKMQGMLEDVSELQFKELPALVDSIKNQVGIDQATQFNADASAALSGLLQNIQGSKQQLDAALGVVTGQAPAGAMAGDMAAANAGIDAAAGDMAAAGEAGAMAGAEAGVDDLDAMAADAGAELDAEEPAGGAGLGRARR